MKEFSGFKKGVNLGGWFSQCDYSKDRLDNFITEDDFKKLSTWGIDHVRLPVDYNLLESEDGKSYLEEGFDRVSRAVGLCKKNGLNIVLDLHKTAGFSFDKGEAQSGFFSDENLQERFYRLWEEISRRFGNDSSIAFELLNEVTDKSYSDEWNGISTECIKRIRKITGSTFILLGGYWNNSIDALKDLPEPYDEKLVYNFHCYEPFLFTHQGATWVDGMDVDFRMSFPSDLSTYKKAASDLNLSFATASLEGLNAKVDGRLFDILFSKALKISEERNVALYCGEYGVIDRASPEETVEWFKAINAAFEKYGIGHAAWTYRGMDFGLSDARLSGVIDRIKNLL